MAAAALDDCAASSYAASFCSDDPLWDSSALPPGCTVRADRLAAMERVQADLTAAGREAQQRLLRFTTQLAFLRMEVHPVTLRTQTLLQAQDNVRAAREDAEELLEHLDTATRVEAAVLAGPGRDLSAFLRALGALQASHDYLTAHRHIALAEKALRDAGALRGEGVDRMLWALRDALDRAREPPSALAKAAAALGPFAAAAPDSPTGSTAAAEAEAAAAPSRKPSPPRERKSPPQLEGLEDAAGEAIPAAELPTLRVLGAALLRCEDRTCLRLYAEARQGVLSGLLHRSFAPPPSGEEPGRVAWKTLEPRIQTWVAGLRLLVAAGRLEHRSAAAVWDAQHARGVFSEVMAAGAQMADTAAANVCVARREPEKVMGLVDMLAGLESAGGALRSLLGDPPPGPLLGVLQRTADRLREEAHECLRSWGVLLSGDPAGKALPPDGGIHAHTASTVAFLRRLLAAPRAVPLLFSPSLRLDAPGGGAGAEAAAVEAVLEEDDRFLDEIPPPPPPPPPPQPEGCVSTDARVAQMISNTFLMLEEALEQRAKGYKTRALGALFLMNNGQHITRAVEAGALGGRWDLGPEWLERHRDAVEDAGQAFQAASWGELQARLAGFTREDLSRAALKDAWREVGASLQELLQAQAQYSAPDPTLRQNLKQLLVEDFLPVYEAFCAKYRDMPFTKNVDKYHCMTAGELEEVMQRDLFKGGLLEGAGSALAPPKGSLASFTHHARA